jgi:hypothetical protein
MALQGQYPNPHAVEPLADAYVLLGDANFTFTTQIGRVSALVYHDQASWDAGLPPVDTVSFVAGVDGFPSFADLMNLPVPENSCNMGEAIQRWQYRVLRQQPPFQGMTWVP